MLKSSFKFMTLLLVGLLSTASRCSKADDVEPEFTSLIGKWELISYSIEAVKLNGEEFNYLEEFKKNGNELFWEFFDHGTMKATENGVTVASNWELNIERLAGKNIDIGQLILTGTYADQLKTALELDELSYHIETFAEANSMNLSIEPRNLSSIYSEVTITYLYQRI